MIPSQLPQQSVCGNAISHIHTYLNETYMQKHHIHNLLEELISDLNTHKPENHIAFMIHWLKNKNITANNNNNNNNNKSSLLITPRRIEEEKNNSNSNSSNEMELQVGVSNININHLNLENSTNNNNNNNNNNIIIITKNKSPELAEFTPVKELCLDVGGIIGQSQDFGIPSRDDGDGMTHTEDSILKLNKNSNASSCEEVNNNNNHNNNISIPYERLESTQKLIEIVQRLPPIYHSSAYGLLEALIDNNKSKSISAINFDNSTMEATLLRESNEQTVSDMMMITNNSNNNFNNNNNNSSLHQFENISNNNNNITINDTPLASTLVQDLVNDAMTASIVARDLIETESNDLINDSSNFTPTIPLLPPMPHANINNNNSTPQHLLLSEDVRPLMLQGNSSINSSLCYVPREINLKTNLTSREVSQENISKQTIYLCEDELSIVREYILSCELLQDLNETQKECIIRCMEHQIINNGELLMMKDVLFFVYSGTLVLEKEEEKKVLRELSKGDFLFWSLETLQEGFEIQNLDGNIRATSDSVIFYIQIQEFNVIKENENEAKRSIFMHIINQSELLNRLPSKDRKKLARFFRVKTFTPGSLIIQQGHPIEWFSLIMSGTVKRKINNNNNNNSFSDISIGKVIGDFEILFHSNALTDIIANTNVVVVVAQLYVTYFEMIVPDPYIELMKSIIANHSSILTLLPLASSKIRETVEQIEKPSSTLRTTRDTVRNSTSTLYSNPQIQKSPHNNNTDKYSSQLKNTKRISSSGEIIFAGKRNVYRFPIAALEVHHNIIIAIVADGTIIRWNNAAKHITGFTSHHILGQSIYKLLTTENTRRSLKQQVLLARQYTGNWSEYCNNGFATPHTYRFHQASQLYNVNLNLTIIPSLIQGGAENVLLLVGREAESAAVVNYVEDAGRWMQNILWPHFRTFQKRVENLKAKDWKISHEEGKRLHDHVLACNQLIGRYVRISNLNMESMNERWKPVSLHHLIRQLTIDIVTNINASGNNFITSIDNLVPQTEVFLDVERVMEVLKHFIYEVNDISTGIQISLIVSIIQPDSPPTISTEGSYIIDISQRGSLPCHTRTPTNTTLISDDSIKTQSTIVTGSGKNFITRKENLWLQSTSQHRQVIDGNSSSSMRRICFIIKENDVEKISEEIKEKEEEEEEEEEDNETPLSPKKINDKEISIPNSKNKRKLSNIKDYERIIAGMGGILTQHHNQSSSDFLKKSFAIELPLLPVPWEDDTNNNNNTEDEEEQQQQQQSGVPISNKAFTVIIADREAKQRSNLCQLMWARRHAVMTVTSYSEVTQKLASGGIDILIIDPLHLDATQEELIFFKEGNSPFDILLHNTHFVVVLHADDFNDWRVRKFAEYSHVIELPKPALQSVLHFAMHEAEQVVTQMRKDEEQIALLRTAFKEYQRDRHKVGKLLGKGAFGEVYEVSDSLTGGKLAMKLMYLNDGVLADDVVQELLAMTSLRHENIIQYFYCAKESDKRLCLYMELAPGGTLQDKIKKQNGRPLPIEDIVQHLHDLCRGLAYLHSKNFVHGDIKTANALIDYLGRIKIGDFGTAKRLKRASDKLYSFAGTPRFMAPELINVDASQGIGYNQKVDIWSLGCVALELVTGRPPFSHLKSTQDMGIFLYISQLTDTPDLSHIEHECNPLLFNFIKSCLNVNPELRPTARELLRHDLLQEVEKNTRNGRLTRQVEMMKTLDFYAAIGPSTGDEFDEDEFEEDDDDEFEEFNNININNNNNNNNNSNDIMEDVVSCSSISSMTCGEGYINTSSYRNNNTNNNNNREQEIWKKMKWRSDSKDVREPSFSCSSSSISFSGEAEK